MVFIKIFILIFIFYGGVKLQQWISRTLCFCLATFANAADIVGTWKTIDDKTGYVLAHVKIEQLADKSYIGAIIEQFTYPG